MYKRERARFTRTRTHAKSLLSIISERIAWRFHCTVKSNVFLRGTWDSLIFRRFAFIWIIFDVSVLDSLRFSNFPFCFRRFLFFAKIVFLYVFIFAYLFPGVIDRLPSDLVHPHSWCGFEIFLFLFSFQKQLKLRSSVASRNRKERQSSKTASKVDKTGIGQWNKYVFPYSGCLTFKESSEFTRLSGKRVKFPSQQ